MRYEGLKLQVPLTHHDLSDLGLIYLINKHKIRFRILSELRIQSWIFLKKRTNHSVYYVYYGFREPDDP